jgi:hypothetical protein
VQLGKKEGSSAEFCRAGASTNRGEQTALPLDYENPQFLPNTDIASISNWHQSWNQSLRQIHDFEPHSWVL